MKPEDYPRLREIFLAARERLRDERARYLDEACGADRELRAEVESLCAHHDELSGFLETPVLGAGFQLGPADEGVDVAHRDRPALIGKYRILRVLGEGGMGVVYLAEQESPRRTVALKVIQPGLASPSRLKRFEHEADILGRLQHPGIAQIYEAGTADTGRGAQPFFAMELIQGETVTSYAERLALRTRERLALFVKICAGVQHAHEKGVIHRDLKPGNILVDASGQTKILDFGIARATDSDVRTATLATDVGQVVGTLPYMSPEQVSGDAGALDTRSDVYALGVIGYELLTGALPYDVRQKPLPEAARIIREEDPTRLSAVNRVFRGDLETIFAKTLEKDRARRYSSAAELAADVERYLADQPILARPPSAAYQLSKFARRNKALVGGVIGVFLALVGGVIATARQAGIARENETAARLAEGDAKKQLAIAQREARKAKEVRRFLTDTLSSGIPGEKGLDARMIDVLDQSAETLVSAFADEPEVKAVLQHTMGTAYYSIGAYDKAEPLLRDALATLERELGDESDETLDTLSNLAVLLHARGGVEESEALYRRALALQMKTQGDDGRDALNTRNNLAVLLQEDGRLDEAASILSSALEVLRTKRGEDDPDTLQAMENLAIVENARGNERDAEKLTRAAFDGLARTRGPEHPDTLAAAMNVATLLKQMGRYEESEALTRTTLEAQKRVLPPDHPSTLRNQKNLACALVNLGRNGEAEPLMRATLEAQEKKLGATHKDALSTKTELGVLLKLEGRLEEAERVLREAFEQNTSVQGKRHPDTLRTEQGLASVLCASKRAADAFPLLQDAVAAYAEMQGAEGFDTLIARNNLAMCLVWMGRQSEAEPLMRASLELDERSPAMGPDHRETLTTLNNLARVLEDLQRYDEAEAFFRRALERSQRTLAGDDPALIDLRRNYAEMLVAMERWKDAEDLLRANWEVESRALAPDDPVAITTRFNLGVAQCQQHKDDEGLATLEAVLESARNSGAAAAACKIERQIGALLIARKRFADAEPHLIAALRSLPEAAAGNAVRTDLVKQIVHLYEAWERPDKAAEFRALLP